MSFQGMVSGTKPSELGGVGLVGGSVTSMSTSMSRSRSQSMVCSSSHFSNCGVTSAFTVWTLLSTSTKLSVNSKGIPVWRLFSLKLKQLNVCVSRASV